MNEFDNCVSLIEMAELINEDADNDTRCCIGERTVNIVMGQFPTFLSTAKIFWPVNIECILTPEEEEAAIDAMANIATNGFNRVESAEAYADDIVTLVTTAAAMMERVEEYRA